MTDKTISWTERDSVSFQAETKAATVADIAEALYLQRPKKYNCAQAIAQAFDRNDLVDSLASCGGGRAPDGFCGALYAALLLVPDGKQDAVKHCFQQAVGNLRCKSIRQVGQTPCAACIRTAAEILEKERKP